MDGAFILMISSILDGTKKVLRYRERPKETTINATISRVLFGDEPKK